MYSIPLTATQLYNAPENAFQILSNEASSHTLSLGKTSGTGNALFMFEFRDPSSNITFSDPDVVSVPFEFSPVIGLFTSAIFWGSLHLKRRMNLSK